MVNPDPEIHVAIYVTSFSSMSYLSNSEYWPLKLNINRSLAKQMMRLERKYTTLICLGNKSVSMQQLNAPFLNKMTLLPCSYVGRVCGAFKRMLYFYYIEISSHMLCILTSSWVLVKCVSSPALGCLCKYTDILSRYNKQKM